VATTLDPPVSSPPPARPAETGEAAIILRARRGDRKAFSRLTEPYRRELIAYCYRLTGSLTEAEDMVQESLLRAFRALETFEGRASLRAWLYRIAHNLCVNHVQRRPPLWQSLEEVEPTAPDAAQFGQERENVRLGFVALVQSLPPKQRAALVLRDVLGWSAEETARILETTVPAVKNALARARQTLASHPSGGDPDDVRDLAASDPEVQATVAQWVDAFEKGNTARMVELLTGDWTLPPCDRTPRTGYKHTETAYGEKETDRKTDRKIDAKTEREERTHGERAQRPEREQARRRTPREQ